MFISLIRYFITISIDVVMFGGMFVVLLVVLYCVGFCLFFARRQKYRGLI